MNSTWLFTSTQARWYGKCQEINEFVMGRNRIDVVSLSQKTRRMKSEFLTEFGVRLLAFRYYNGYTGADVDITPRVLTQSCHRRSSGLLLSKLRVIAVKALPRANALFSIPSLLAKMFKELLNYVVTKVLDQVEELGGVDVSTFVPPWLDEGPGQGVAHRGLVILLEDFLGHDGGEGHGYSH
ncbi:hypothetical protein JHK87_047414 [Glycine soja]|nr:hypothetical protein JHK87_047414 [Glycine soja]